MEPVRTIAVNNRRVDIILRTWRRGCTSFRRCGPFNEKRGTGTPIGWEARGSRIITGCFKTKNKKIKMNIVECYAPTNDKTDETKEPFYNQLHYIMSNLGDKNVNLIMGDFNSKIGSDNQGYENVMGMHGLGVMNDNGERFVNACAANSIVIGGSLFHHRRIHKATWVSPDRVTENQIDHIGMNQMFRRSLQDVRVKRGADVASDHHLVTTN